MLNNFYFRIRFMAFKTGKEEAGLNAFSIFMKSQLDETTEQNESASERARFEEKVPVYIAVGDRMLLGIQGFDFAQIQSLLPKFRLILPKFDFNIA